MEAGKRLFSERGYYHVHAGDIAAEADVAVGSFYAYFNDKHELLIALVDEYSEGVLERESSVADAEDHTAEFSAEDILLRVFRASVSAHRESLDFFREVLRLSLTDPEVRERQERIDRQARSALEAGISALNGNVGEKRARELAFLVYYASEGVIHRLVLAPGEVDEERVVESLARICAAFLADEVKSK